MRLFLILLTLLKAVFSKALRKHRHTWQNLLFFQSQRRSNDPASQFFVPLQRGANTTLRYLGQLAFTF